MTDAKAVVTPPTVATPEEVQEYKAEQLDEYGTFVAVAPIFHRGARAYNKGDAVPVSNVTAHKYDAEGLVAKVTSKAGQDVIRAAHAASQLATADEVPPVTLSVPVQ